MSKLSATDKIQLCENIQVYIDNLYEKVEINDGYIDIDKIEYNIKQLSESYKKTMTKNAIKHRKLMENNINE